jgi:adenine phosphoribosyltransferase
MSVPEEVQGLIKRTLREVADFPKPGILFSDITPIFLNPSVYNHCLDAFAA